jgi:peroxiredoxin
MQELPILQKLHQEYLQRGVIFISVNAFDQDTLEKVQDTVNKNQITFPVLLDQDRQFADTYQAMFFPTTFIIDASGVIHEVSLGDNTEAELRSSLENLLAGNF